MPDLQMVPVVRVSHGFEARVVAAKLGSEGIVTQFRGAVEGPYPVGSVEVLVPSGDVDEARQILAVERSDDVDPPTGTSSHRRAGSRAPALLLLVLVLVALALATALGSGFGR